MEGRYLGLDLGTTNSAAALFDGERVDFVRNPQGNTLTPSVVRIDARGNVTVGARARRALETDPGSVQLEFKRLMGSPKTLEFASSGVHKRPEELAAAVLRALREDVQAQYGFLPARAAIGVPALFELPQAAATSEAARLAGFERVELIQEPVASALAAGWTADDGSGAWLVYDLGGGTFDVSLLETQDGHLRVVGHDGDNFLGGRDIDAAIVDWMLGELSRQNIALSPADPACAPALRRLRLIAEEAKIELSRARETDLVLRGLELNGRTVDTELLLDRATLDSLLDPLIDRTLAIAQRLLSEHGITLDSHLVRRVVLVGGPTVIPRIRERVSEHLGAPIAEGTDPLTLVARGAAYFAASASLEAAPTAPPATSGRTVWLQYPAVTSDLTPYVIGKVIDDGSAQRPAHVCIERQDGGWSTRSEAVDADGTFAVTVRLTPRGANVFRILGKTQADDDILLSPATFTMVHGVTIGDPPLSRTIGVALATGRVRVFFKRGSPLPMRRTFQVRSVTSLSPEDPEGVLSIPIVQGEFDQAQFCRLVGALEISASQLTSVLPAGSAIELTLEVDRGGRLTASARVPKTAQVFDRVSHIVSEGVPVEELRERLAEVQKTLNETRSSAFRHGARAVVEKLLQGESRLARAALDEERARGGDADAAERVRRELVELDALVAEAQTRR